VPGEPCAVAEDKAQYTRHRRSRFAHVDRLFPGSANVREGSGRADDPQPLLRTDLTDQSFTLEWRQAHGQAICRLYEAIQTARLIYHDQNAPVSHQLASARSDPTRLTASGRCRILAARGAGGSKSKCSLNCSGVGPVPGIHPGAASCLHLDEFDEHRRMISPAHPMPLTDPLRPVATGSYGTTNVNVRLASTRAHLIHDAPRSLWRRVASECRTYRISSLA
jgi:hypothetical protein